MSVRTTARKLVLAAAAMALVGVAGCSDDDAGRGREAPADFVETVIHATTEAGTAHFQTSLDGDADEALTPVYQFEGDVSFETNAVRYEVRALAGLQPEEFRPRTDSAEAVIVGGRGWQRGSEDEPWREAGPNFDALVPWVSAGTATPEAALRAALSPLTFTRVGNEEIGDVSATRYRSEGQRTIDLWVDSESRIVWLRSDAAHPNPTYAQQGQRERWVVKLTALGETIEPAISAPVS